MNPTAFSLMRESECESVSNLECVVGVCVCVSVCDFKWTVWECWEEIAVVRSALKHWWQSHTHGVRYSEKFVL